MGCGVNGVLAEGFGGDIVESFCQDFGGGVLIREGDDSFAVGLPEGGEEGIRGVHAKGVVVGIDERGDGFLDDFEVADHRVGVEVIGFEEEVDFAAMAVGEAAVIRVIRKLVTVFDFDRFANPVRHEEAERLLLVEEGVGAQGAAERFEVGLGLDII